MSTRLSIIQTLYQYTSWANGLLFEAATQLTPEQFATVQEETEGSVCSLLTHLLAVQETWLHRLGGDAQPVAFAASQEPDISTLVETWRALDLATQTYLATLSDTEIDVPVRYLNERNELNVYARWQILFHLVNHAAQHRSEAALLLTRYGRSPGWFDFPFYLDERDGTTIHDETDF